MNEFGFYVKMGLDHVLDPNAYDHVLFLLALALPFVFRQWAMLGEDGGKGTIRFRAASTAS